MKSPVENGRDISIIMPPAILPRLSLSAREIATAQAEKAAIIPVVDIPKFVSALKITKTFKTMSTVLTMKLMSDTSRLAFERDIASFKTLVMSFVTNQPATTIKAVPKSRGSAEVTKALSHPNKLFRIFNEISIFPQKNGIRYGCRLVAFILLRYR